MDLSVSEDLAEQKVFATLTIDDPDANNDHTCNITAGNDNDAFALDSADHGFSGEQCIRH